MPSPLVIHRSATFHYTQPLWNTSSYTPYTPGDRPNKPVLRSQAGPEVGRGVLPDGVEELAVQRLAAGRRPPRRRHELVGHAPERAGAEGGPGGLAAVLHVPPVFVQLKEDRR